MRRPAIARKLPEGPDAMQLALEKAARWRFRPGLWPTLVAAMLVPAFVSLGQWQLAKARAKEAAQARLDSQRREPPVAIPASPIDDPSALHLRRVVAVGEYEPAGQILIDNRVLHERAGFHVLTPLRVGDPGHDGPHGRILVNRGWIAALPGSPRAPKIPTPAGPVVVEGTAVVPSNRFFALAADTAAPGGNAIWQNLDLARYRDLAPHPVQPVVLLLDAGSPAGGFDRAWPRLDERHERHLSYAYQWFGFAVATIAIWAWFAMRGPGRAGLAPGAAS